MAISWHSAAVDDANKRRPLLQGADSDGRPIAAPVRIACKQRPDKCPLMMMMLLMLNRRPPHPSSLTALWCDYSHPRAHRLDLTYVTYALSFPVEHKPQTTFLHPVQRAVIRLEGHSRERTAQVTFRLPPPRRLYTFFASVGLSVRRIIQQILLSDEFLRIFLLKDGMLLCADPDRNLDPGIL